MNQELRKPNNKEKLKEAIRLLELALDDCYRLLNEAQPNEQGSANCPTHSN